MSPASSCRSTAERCSPDGEDIPADSRAEQGAVPHRLRPLRLGHRGAVGHAAGAGPSTPRRWPRRAGHSRPGGQRHVYTDTPPLPQHARIRDLRLGTRAQHRTHCASRQRPARTPARVPRAPRRTGERDRLESRRHLRPSTRAASSGRHTPGNHASEPDPAQGSRAQQRPARVRAARETAHRNDPTAFERPASGHCPSQPPPSTRVWTASSPGGPAWTSPPATQRTSRSTRATSASATIPPHCGSLPTD